MASTKSLLAEHQQVNQAIRLMQLGARMAVLESETSLSHERLVRLYREVMGCSPSKGQLPYSTDWFMSWQPNIHASLFLNIHENLDKTSALERIDLLVKAWELYQTEAQALGVEAMLSITRAWRLVKFVDSDMLCLTACTHCGGQFVTHRHDWDRTSRQFVCGLCDPPARAGKSRRSGSIH
jgi:flagellar transcriptional activator FlhC